MNHESPLPLYFQLARDIREMIESGELKKGARLPSEMALSDTHGIGRPTVRQALELLQRKGLVIKRKGSGTFVSESPKAIDLFSMAGTSAAFMKEGLQVKRTLVKVLEKVMPDETNPLYGIKSFRLLRLSSVDGFPVILEEIFMDSLLFRGIEKFDLEKRPLSNIIETEFYMKPSGGRQSFGIKFCGEYESGLLGLGRNDPVLSVKRELYFKQYSNVFYTELLCRTDRFVFYQDLGDLAGEQGVKYE
ncbi:MAG: GntR family transcriptional regulator [Brevinematales bacterium]